jgi:3-oxoacyl-[acyl-carrier protein] reductase
MMDLAGRVALVTGGATGIGRATVLELAKAGAGAVAINYRTAKDDALRLAAELSELGVQAVGIQADVKSDEQVRQMVQQVGHRFGRLDVLVNNAGLTHWVPVGDLEALTDAMWDEILDVNLKAAFRCTRAAAGLLGEAQGVVINVASISGILATTTSSSLAYGAAKAGLIYLTRGLAVALGPRVRVNAVAPAFTDTQWMRSHYGEDYERVVSQAASIYPLRRIATPQDVAAAIVSLVTGGDFVTGQTLVVDGGLSLS